MPGGRYRNSEAKASLYDESTQPPAQDRVRNCHDLSQEARTKKMWVYDPANKTWYTPEEFDERFGRMSQGFEQFVEKVQIRDPKDGVNAGFRRLLDMQIKLEEFVKKMTEYYKEKPRL